MRDPGALFNGQTFHLALDEPKSLKMAFATGLEQQLKTQANAKHWPIGLVPALEIGNQPVEWRFSIAGSNDQLLAKRGHQLSRSSEQPTGKADNPDD